MAKKKLAVLGGGTGAIGTVWALTTLPDWQEKWDITVYQMGWRLGGKGASGRNPYHGQRIEEHGLHVWAGFYQNAFRLMRDVYEAYEPEPDCPIKTWRDAFKPQHNVIVEEEVGGEWKHWYINWPPTPGEPGDDLDDDPVSEWGYLLKLLDWLVDYLRNSDLYDDDCSCEGGEPSLWEVLTGGNDREDITPETPELRGFPEDLSFLKVPQLIKGARDFMHWLAADPHAHLQEDQTSIIRLLEDAFEKLRGEFEEELDENDAARRLYFLLDSGLATVRGMIGDAVLIRGWGSIDMWEWRDWMRRWGCSDYTLNGVLVRGIYDYIFGFPNGNLDFPRVAAGVAVHALFRLVFGYRGSLFYFMQAGMGDTIFSPLYLVLKDRGVKFEYFNKVKNLGVDDTGEVVDSILIERQATIKPELEGYDPLITVKGIPSWPSYPFYDQLVEGDELRDRGINLESNWADWDGVGEFTLRRGVDFDEVVLGIPPTAFPHIASEMMEASERFKRMVYAQDSSPTCAVQLWFDDDRCTLGAPDEPVITTAYIDPINTWSDMTHLIKCEEWGDQPDPKFCAYFCGPYNAPAHFPDYSDHGFPQRELDRFKEICVDWFAKNTEHIWDRADLPGPSPGLDYELLHGEGDGQQKFDEQYFRVNLDPSELYMLSTPGSISMRLEAGDSQFDNVYLAGDWVYTSLSAGCIECCVMAALHAAEAISGEEFEIYDRYDKRWRDDD